MTRETLLALADRVGEFGAWGLSLAALVVVAIVLVAGLVVRIIWQHVRRPRPKRFDSDEAWIAFEEGRDQ